jgi:molybdenum cofactor biosynthesis enzyme MoaA
MNKELNTFITNTGSLNERISRATGLPDVDSLLDAMKTRENNRATDLLVGSACNEECVSCFFQEKGGAGIVRLTPDVIEDIRQTAQVLGGPLFTLYPKEITTALPLLPVFSEQGITKTLTNAKLLGKPGMLETLKNAGIKELMITVPGQAEAYATYTRESPQSYGTLLTNIELAIQNGFDVGVFYPVFTKNIQDVVPTTLMLQSLGVSDIKFIRVRPMGAAQNLPDDMFLNAEQTMNFLYNVNDARNLTNKSINLTLFGGSFGPNFFGTSIYKYLSGQIDQWPSSKYD